MSDFLGSREVVHEIFPRRPDPYPRLEWSQASKEALLGQALRERDDAYLGAIQTLAFLVEAKDEVTRRHLDRSYRYGLRLAGMIDPSLARDPQLAYGFLLHDIGKVGIPERILTKEGPLAPAEWTAMKAHPMIGARIVAPIRFLGRAVDVIRCHHELFDGSGYPQRLSGEQIPLSARIFTVIDVFDALTTDRPYRAAVSNHEAIDEIARGSGTRYDPTVVEAFLEMMAQLQAEGDEALDAAPAPFDLIKLADEGPLGSGLGPAGPAAADTA